MPVPLVIGILGFDTLPPGDVRCQSRRMLVKHIQCQLLGYIDALCILASIEPHQVPTANVSHAVNQFLKSTIMIDLDIRVRLLT